MPVGVDLGGAEVGAESSGGVAVVAHVAYLNASLVDLTAKTASRTGRSTDMEQHISIYTLIFGTGRHALTRGVIGKRTRWTGTHA